MEEKSKTKIKNQITVGLIGNPNVGKSTLFNNLTGSHQHVGNWPGKTVEKKEGYYQFDDHQINLVDLPGAYSLTAYTEEESVTSDFILKEKPNVIVQIIDATNFERNLFLTVQLLELGAPLVIALNMVDLAKKEGLSIHISELAKLLNTPVVRIEANKKIGLSRLNQIILGKSLVTRPPRLKITYGREVDRQLGQIKKFLRARVTKKINFHWLALKLLEGDLRARQMFADEDFFPALTSLVNQSINHLEKIYGKDISSILANIRFGFINGISQEVIKRPPASTNRPWPEKIDRLLTNRYFGIPFFLIIAGLLFQATFALAAPLVDLIDQGFQFLNRLLTEMMPANTPPWLESLLTDGLINGLGAVLTFLPNIFILFVIIAILEDSGYMARVAFVMDKLMHRLGLHGKAFIPLILGFGCNVPAIMATRTLSTKKDRLLTILINPFISCSARLPIYTLFAGAFFSAYQGWIILSLYLLGVLVAIGSGIIFKKIFFPGLSSPFVIELPSYRWPTIKGLAIHAGTRTWAFIKKAGTIILVLSIFVWLLASFPATAGYASAETFIGRIGQTIAPVFSPLGFGQWQAAVAILTGFTAKEAVVSTFGALYQLGDSPAAADLQHILQNQFTPLAAYAFMVFTLIYTPCLAAIATIKQETKSWKWPLVSISYSVTLAWLLSFAIFQLGRLAGFE